MKNGLVALIVWIVVGGVGLAEDGLVIPPRPRLLFTEERTSLLQQAEQTLTRGVTVPRGEGDWIFYYACPADGTSLRAESDTVHVCPRCGAHYSDERIIGAWRTQQYLTLESDLDVLARVWSLTRERRFFDPIRHALLQLARDWPTYTRHDRWGRRGLLAVVGGRRYCQLLDEALSLIRLAGIYDRVAESPFWEPSEREFIEKQQFRMPLEEIGRFELFINPRNNHQSWFNAAYATVGLALGDPDWIRRGIAGPRGLLKQLETSVTRDGLWYEGTIAYHFYALQAIQQTLEVARKVGWSLTDHPKLKSLWLGPLQLAYPDGSFPVLHDSDPVHLSTYSGFYRWAAEYFSDPRLEAAVPTGLGSTNLQGIGLAVLRRPGLDGRPICVMMDYGLHGDHHGHPDKLSIVIHALGQELVLDPGRISYSVPEYQTWARTTVAHNTLVWNQKDQQPDTGQLLFFDERPEGVAALAESRGAYSGIILRRFLVLTDRFLVDALSLQSGIQGISDWILHGRGTLTGPATLRPRLKPLGTTNGYQHLVDLQGGLHTNGVPCFTFSLPNGKTWHLWTPGDEEGTQLFTGTAIGYRLDDPVPFVLRRRENAQTLFVAVLDLSGTNVIRSVKTHPVNDQQGRPVSLLRACALDIQGEFGRCRIALDLSDEPITSLFDGTTPFRRWRITWGEP